MALERVVAALMVALTAALGGLDCGTGDDPGSAMAVVGGARFEIEVVHTPADRARGLSERDGLPTTGGMLFVFESGRASSFWMKGMRFPLDFIWIGEDCTVVDTTTDVPPPDAGAADADLPRYDSALPAAYTLEVNAGMVRELGIRIGDAVSFHGLPQGVSGADC